MRLLLLVASQVLDSLTVVSVASERATAWASGGKGSITRHRHEHPFMPATENNQIAYRSKGTHPNAFKDKAAPKGIFMIAVHKVGWPLSR